MSNQGNSFKLFLPTSTILVESDRIVSFSSKINVPNTLLTNDTGHKKVAKRILRAYTRNVNCSWEGEPYEYTDLEDYMSLFTFKGQNNPLLFLEDYVTPVSYLEGFTFLPVSDTDGFSPSNALLKFARYKAVITALSRTRVFSDLTINLAMTVCPFFES